ncbi:hypothetical protein ZWY2020_010315 [Hordeum vulgare]|nr:hypothetical protein ZWY2020_010315 [Hordeum vulgare]
MEQIRGGELIQSAEALTEKSSSVRLRPRLWSGSAEAGEDERREWRRRRCVVVVAAAAAADGLSRRLVGASEATGSVGLGQRSDPHPNPRCPIPTAAAATATATTPPTAPRSNAHSSAEATALTSRSVKSEGFSQSFSTRL